MTITIYHNPACGTSRNVLKMIEDTGKGHSVILYLKTPPTQKELESLIKRSDKTVREHLRRRGSPYDDLGLDDPKWTDSQLLDLMCKHPALIERPVVATDKGVRLCRPKERLAEILDIA